MSPSRISNAAATDHGIHVEIVSDPAVFGSMEAEWGALLPATSADRLFLSWQWMYTWWDTWAGDLGLDLCILTARREGELIGIAPLYLDSVRVRQYLPVRRLQFIGNAWQRTDTVRTEYLGFITASDISRELCDAFLAFIFDSLDWDEFVICDLSGLTDTSVALHGFCRDRKRPVFHTDIDFGIRIPVQGDFADYLKTMGKNTRLKFYNRRTYLDKLATHSIEYATPGTLDTHFSALNLFHRERWGADCFAGKSIEFHRNLLGRLGPSQKMLFSTLFIDNEPVSTSYNISAGDTVYNVQAGFYENYDKKLSLGTLHMGYAVENAFKSAHVKYFDLLAGNGKNEFYKQKYPGERMAYCTLIATRGKLISLVRWIESSTPEPIKRVISRVLALFRNRSD